MMGHTIYNPVIRDTTTFLNTALQTGHKFTEVEVTLMPGGGTPLHYHKSYEEHFLVVEGTLGLQLGKKNIRLLRPEESCTVPTAALHRFFNPTDKPVKFKAMIVPGHTGFENALHILYGLAADGLTDKKSVPRKLSYLAVISVMSDMNLPGPLSLFSPFFRWYARSRVGKSVRHQLIGHYCRNIRNRKHILNGMDQNSPEEQQLSKSQLS